MEPWTLGPLTIYPFGVIMAVAALIGIGMTALAMRGKGLKPETASWFALLAVPLCYILARLGYCLFIVDQMMGNHDFDRQDHEPERRQRRGLRGAGRVLPDHRGADCLRAAVQGSGHRV